MENDTRIYEFGFLLSGLLPEAGVLSLLEKIEKTFESLGGKIKEKSTPERKVLAYPINKQNEAYFNYFYIELEPEKLEDVREKFKYDADILRYLCLIISTDPSKIEKKAKEPRPSREKVRATPVAEAGEPSAEVNLEELNHKLDEIKELS
ncbi:MAG TPA: 30S ribosomal protein S6 [Candidatus Paceibacterota bacterium]|nr:30S ribosomal protein S6 [Candidatus Paceibacterota bacterium]